MVMQKIQGNQGGSIPAPESYELKVDGSTQIDKVQQRLVGMWASVVNDRVFENPVLLNNFFGEYAAYVGFYSSMVDQLFRATTKVVEEATNQVYREQVGASATFIDSLIRRTERHISKDLTFHERELKTFNNNINAMQTKLRLYGDEAKTMAGRE